MVQWNLIIHSRLRGEPTYPESRRVIRVMRNSEATKVEVNQGKPSCMNSSGKYEEVRGKRYMFLMINTFQSNMKS